MKQYEEKLKREDYRFGIVGALIANQWRKKGSKPIVPGDLFPRLSTDKEDEGVIARTPEEMHSLIQSFRKQRES